MIRRALLVLMIAGLSTLPAAYSAWKTVGEVDGELAVENPRLDLGDVKAGTDAVATFVFRNTGNAAVRIIRAKPS
jgi:hypothetical protein